jgi:hypothetical protein
VYKLYPKIHWAWAEKLQPHSKSEKDLLKGIEAYLTKQQPK